MEEEPERQRCTTGEENPKAKQKKRSELFFLLISKILLILVHICSSFLCEYSWMVVGGRGGREGLICFGASDGGMSVEGEGDKLPTKTW